MVVLKKIKGSTLMETLVSSVLIVIIFMITSMILNNLFSNSIKNNTHDINTKIDELHYQYLKGNLPLPYADSYKTWSLSAEMINENGESQIAFEAVNPETNKRLIKIINEN